METSRSKNTNTTIKICLIMKYIGLINKYIISRRDGTPIDPEDEYFVLKVSGKGDPIHIAACRKAVIAYAEAIKDHLPILSEDLIYRYKPLL